MYHDRFSLPATLYQMASEDSNAVDVRVSFAWRPAGTISLEDSGRLRFPVLPASPGLYRITLTARPDEVRPHVYVGESDNLRRRASHYRNPGPTQQTNIRLNRMLRSHLEGGGIVSLDVATEVFVGVAAVPLDLRASAARRLAENAAVVGIALAGAAGSANL
jgi:hypothetical protein